MSRVSWQTSRRSKPDLWSGNSQSGSILGDTSSSTPDIATLGRSSRGGDQEGGDIPEEFSDDSDDERPGAYAVSRRCINHQINSNSQWDPTAPDSHSDCDYDSQYHGEASVTGHESELNTTLGTNPESYHDSLPNTTVWKTLKERKWLVVVVVVSIVVVIGIVTGVVVKAHSEQGFPGSQSVIGVPIDQCNYADQEDQVDPFLQCECFQQVTQIIDSVESAYKSFISFGGIVEMLDHDIDINSCSPQNIALLWVATEIADAKKEGRTILDETLRNRFVLVNLYTTLGGPKWVVNLNWLGNSSECDWHGVTCDDGGNKVLSFSMPKNNLQGSLSSSLGLLQNLTALDLSDNFIGGTIPKEVLQLPKLGK
jgi:hypothetical protein